MIPHELENILSLDRNNLRAGGAGPCAADLHGLASHDCALVSAEIGELDSPHPSLVRLHLLRLGLPRRTTTEKRRWCAAAVGKRAKRGRKQRVPDRLSQPRALGVGRLRESRR